jgi:hypothetical protein
LRLGPLGAGGLCQARKAERRQIEKQPFVDSRSHGNLTRVDDTVMKIIRAGNRGVETTPSHRGHGGHIGRETPESGALAFIVSRLLQSAHVCQEFAIPSGLAEFIDQQFHGFHRRERVQDFLRTQMRERSSLGMRTLLYACPSVECRWPGIRACRRVCARG